MKKNNTHSLEAESSGRSIELAMVQYSNLQVVAWYMYIFCVVQPGKYMFYNSLVQRLKID